MSYYVERLGLVVKALSKQIEDIEDDLLEIGQRNAAIKARWAKEDKEAASAQR